MRLLDTRTGQFRWVDDPRQVRYAILSHTWNNNGKQTYRDLIELQVSIQRARSRQWPFESDDVGASDDDAIDPSVSISSILEHPGLSAKIRNACAVALEDSYELLWVDACCID